MTKPCFQQLGLNRNVVSKSQRLGREQILAEQALRAMQTSGTSPQKNIYTLTKQNFVENTCYGWVIALEKSRKREESLQAIKKQYQQFLETDSSKQ